jgi:predicted 2-oxoglutarate/Fe(II)-dependent dioxygenase YbiX
MTSIDTDPCLRSYLSASNLFPSHVLSDLEKFVKTNSKPFGDNGYHGEKKYKNSNGDLSKERQLWKVPIHSPSLKEFYTILESTIHKANEHFNFNIDSFQSVHYAEYSSQDITSLDWHMDIENHFPFNKRKLSFTILVNDPKEYKGGGLTFYLNHDNLATAPKSIGGFTIFPSYILHKVDPVFEGIRKVIIGFIEGPSFK